MMNKRPLSIISITAVVFKNDHGFVARAAELPLVSSPAKTRSLAVKDLTEALNVFLTAQADHGTLLATLDQAGFTGAIGSNKVEAHVYSSKIITVPLPSGALGNEALARLKAQKGESHVG
jgi:predicted RNase H-like HicB family nuclease